VTYDRWFDQKHGKLSARHQWVKLHVMCGTVTHAITGARVTSEGDCPQLPALLANTMRHHDVREVSADKAYSSVDNHNVLESFDVAAFVPFKINAVVNPKAPVWSRHLVEFTLNQERFLQSYHRRSNVETVFSMLKARFGASVASRLPTAC
jgi:transposase